jgi:hypothetical protein
MTNETEVVLFQYMIGNTDWRFKGGHNHKYLKSLTSVTTDVIPVPYDFDYAGLVNTSYAIPQEWTSIKTITEREYLGYCRNDDEAYLPAIDYLNDKKDEILQLIEDFKYLDDKDKRKLIRYIEDFYDLTENPVVMRNIMKRECRSIDF